MVKRPLKNSSLQSKTYIIKTGLVQYFFVLALSLFLNLNAQQQIANYISNGGMEDKYDCNFPSSGRKAKFWRGLDSLADGIVYASSCFGNIPFNGFTYQWPQQGNSYFTATVFCPAPNCGTVTARTYFRNRLKTNLTAGKTYCVKFYVNISNQSTYGISTIGAYFGDNSLDTITKGLIPLTYINPQVENPTTNIITDTMNWTLITGTFVANGNEKHCVIGNFKSDAATTKTPIVSSSIIGCDITLDNVSCIPTDLPAYAGADLWAIPGQTVYIGRTQDVGIDEACTWYNLSNTLTPIANVAGMTLTVALSTQTYMVKQDICGIVKYDTVIVHASGLGHAELQYLTDNIKLYPQPASTLLNIETAVTEAGLFSRVSICNALGQMIREEELNLSNGSQQLDISDLADGFYTLQFSTTKGYTLKKSLVVSR